MHWKFFSENKFDQTFFTIIEKIQHNKAPGQGEIADLHFGELSP